MLMKSALFALATAALTVLSGLLLHILKKAIDERWGQREFRLRLATKSGACFAIATCVAFSAFLLFSDRPPGMIDLVFALVLSILTSVMIVLSMLMSLVLALMKVINQPSSSPAPTP